MTSVIAKEFRRKVGKEVTLEAEGLERFIVYTPFTFDDGDRYVVILKRDGGKWVLTDEGHTFMHLSYDEVDVSSGTRAKVIEQTVLDFNLQNRAGELRLEIPDNSFGDALFTFIQALAQIVNTSRWTIGRVQSTFIEDFAAIVESSVPIGRAVPGWRDSTIDPNGDYPVDYMIQGHTKPHFVFGVSSDTACRDATITCLHYEKSRFEFGSTAVYEDQTQISRRAVAQLTDIIGKAFSNLGSKERIRDHLASISANGN